MWSVFSDFETGGRSPDPFEKRPATDSRRGHPRVRRWAWIAVLVFFVGGDLATTAIGTATPGVMEVNPSIAVLLEKHGLLGMAALKVVVVVAASVVYWVVPRPHDVSVPLGFGAVGVIVTGWNLIVLGSLVFV